MELSQKGDSHHELSQTCTPSCMHPQERPALHTHMYTHTHPCMSLYNCELCTLLFITHDCDLRQKVELDSELCVGRVCKFPPLPMEDTEHRPDASLPLRC